MTRRLPIGAKRLIRCKADFLDGVREVSIFPFFESGGDVRTVLVVDAQQNELRELLDWRLLRVPLLSKVEFYCSWLNLPLLESFAGLSETWHYDPLFVARPMAHPLRESMLQTNCVDDFPWQASNVYFHGDLTAVKWLYKQTSSETQLVRFKPEHLPDPPCFPADEPASPRDSGQWTLSPIWER